VSGFSNLLIAAFRLGKQGVPGLRSQHFRRFDSIHHNIFQLLPPNKMPTVAVDKADLWERLGKEYSELPGFLPSLVADL